MFTRITGPINPMWFNSLVIGHLTRHKRVDIIVIIDRNTRDESEWKSS